MTDKNSKISKLAIASLLIPCVSIIGSLFFILTLYHGRNLFSALLAPFAFTGLFLSPVSLTLGILAMIKILRSHNLLKGYTFALLGILLSVPAFYCGGEAIADIRLEARLTICQHGMMEELYKAIEAYSNTHNNQYPAADKWCDLLAENPDIKGWFLCSESQNVNRELPYKCSYAINPNAEPNSAGDVVLLFETKDSWNQFGGPELMVFDNHYRKGCNVLFNYGSTKFILPKQKNKLNWGK